MQLLRSLLFNVLFYGITAVLCLALLWMLVLSKPRFLAIVRWYLRLLHGLERHVIGLDYRVEGRDRMPTGPCIVAAKHQSAWETLKLHLIFDDPAVILKQELLHIPVWGWYARKADLIPVKRGGKAKAIQSIVAGARRMVAQNRPIVIFPQGTRLAAGAYRPYRAGVFALYEALDLPVVPVALNSGVFWARKAWIKRPGTITVRFLEPIPPGLDRTTFMQRLERTLEAESDRLSAAVGGPVVADGLVPDLSREERLPG